MIDERGGSSLVNADKAKHEWTSPPPGAGPLPVCKHCGTRRTPDAEHFGCRRDRYEAAPINHIDYDPLP